MVVGAIATARNLKISPMIVGLTIVALGTSAPEIFVATVSSIQGKTELAVGNAIGSNIANIGMVLGITAFVVPLPFRKETLYKDLPILLLVTLLAGITLWDNSLGVWDGILLIAGLCAFLFRLVIEHRKSIPLFEIIHDEQEVNGIPKMTTLKAIMVLGLSLVFLLFSAEILVWSVTEIARKMGVDELIIGLTVIAVGTSLPELVVSVTSALKKQTDLAIGNIVGSNTFNILVVLAIPSFLSPTNFSPELLWRDYLSMTVMTLALVCFAYGLSGKARITRLEGSLMFAMWVCYLFYLYYYNVSNLS